MFANLKNKRYGNAALLTLLFLLFKANLLWSQYACTPVSGAPLMNFTEGRVGVMSLPSYSAVTMGLADVNDDGVDDLWIQSTNASFRGIFLYLFKKMGRNGVPVFSEPVKIKAPFEDKGKNKGIVFQDTDGKIYSLWKFGSNLKVSLFDKRKGGFQPFLKNDIANLPPRVSDFRLLKSNGKYLFVFGVMSKGVFGPATDWPRVVPYTPEGFWPYPLPQAGIYVYETNAWNGAAIKALPLTSSDQTYYSFDGFSFVEQGKKRFLISGSRLGNIYAYEMINNTKLSNKKYIVDARGNMYRNATVHCFVNYFKTPQGQNGIIAQGEGGIYFYSDKKRQNAKGNLLFGEPVPLLQEDPLLYGGSLVVPTLVDWDGDGVLDIISGTSSGYILFFKNKGTNEVPQMINPVRLKAGGHMIHIQPGYREDIQGPGEARWGYTCPNVADWNSDGLPDIVLGDSRAKFTVYINAGTKREPKLKSPKPIYFKGLDMFGSWRVRPGVGKLGKTMAFINQDKEDELHLYWQIDEYNVAEGGKLKLEDGSTIKGARLPGGAVGRTRIEIADWDGDGVKDLLLGTYGKQSIPEPAKGYPFHFPQRGATPLFLKNMGTEEKPVYAYPKPLLFNGKPILHGGHECGVTTGYFGPGNTLNMLIGEENGKYIFYQRKDLSW
ncbi:FG-GAP repeat domain-containing protein [Niabella aurantiaca]|uniref:FG-GAP repeat domain-containing protein n=1 Tax=Niabella aurantiaca TaxID=379900 RepID=UPI00037C80ED|nr:VCBS repeat-containing protein [Niabella aurantiaca]